MLRIACAASSTRASRCVTKACGSRVWSITWTERPSSPGQIVRMGRPSTRTRLVPFELAEHVHARAPLAQAPAAAEIGQVDDEAAADHLAAGLLDQVERGDGGAARRDQIVDEQDLLARRDGVGVDLDAVRAVLERVVLAERVPGELAALAHGHEAGLELVRDRAAEDESARLDAGHLVDAGAAEGPEETVDRAAQRLRIEQQGGDVAEHHARLRVVRDGADARLDRLGHRTPSASAARGPRRRRGAAPAPGRAPTRP